MNNIIISTEVIETALREHGEYHIPNFGTYILKPRRAGGVGFPHASSNILYSNRIVFKPSKVLKDKVCK